jgi:xylulokinase
LLLLGVDVGTSAVKAVLLDPAGQLVATATAEHPIHRPRPGLAEVDPEDWWRGVVRAVRQVMEGVSEDVAMAVVAPRDPVVLLDARRRPLMRSISWLDRRTVPETREICAAFGLERMIDTTGVVPLAGLTLPVLLWTLRHEPDVWRSTHSVAFIKDFVLARLTGRLDGTDSSMPARSMLNDARAGGWSSEICAAFGIDVAKLPEVVLKPWEPFGELSAEVAGQLGLKPGTAVAVGGGDDPSAALGGGAVLGGELCMGTGTASNWRCVVDAYRPDPAGRADAAAHVVPDAWLFEITIGSTGSSLAWFRDAFCLNGRPQPFAELCAEAEALAPGADGLLFYPYLEGGRSPVFRDEATGVFFGVLGGHSRGHFVRAILEGVAFQYPGTLALLPSVSGPVGMVDGETRSRCWTQIKADVIGLPVRVPEVNEAAGVGACILASLAAGVHPDAATAARAMIRWADVIEPDLESHARYAELRRRYEAVYAHLENAYTIGDAP